MLFALVAGSTEPANCGLATAVMWICGSYCVWNKHHKEEAGPHFCCSVLFSRSMHLPGYIQEGREASYGDLLLGVYHRNSPSCTEGYMNASRLRKLTKIFRKTLWVISFWTSEGGGKWGVKSVLLIWDREYRARIFKLLRSPRIDSKEQISPGCVAWRAYTTTLFQLGS